MRGFAMLICGGVALCAGAGATFAEVRTSTSTNPDSHFAAPLKALLDVEKTGLAATPPSVLTASARPAKRPAKLERPPVMEDGWLATMPPATGGPEWRCLAEAVYFEARGEGLRGQYAVAEVILNRVTSPRFPSTICGVVRQGAAKRGACQFSFACDGRPETISEPAAWDRAAKIARLSIDGAVPDLTEGATHFHTRNVRPGWAARFPLTARIGTHLFYRKPGAGAEVAKAGATQPEQSRTAKVSTKGSARTEAPALHLKGGFALGH